LEQEAVMLVEVKGENELLWNQLARMRAELDEAKRWESDARGVLDIQSAEIQTAKDINGDLEAKLDRERSPIRHVDHEYCETSDIFCEMMNEKDIFENQLRKLQTELYSEKQLAERLQRANDDQTREINQRHGKLKAAKGDSQMSKVPQQSDDGESERLEAE
jgi:hypothetical protein